MPKSQTTEKDQKQTQLCEQVKKPEAIELKVVPDSKAGERLTAQQTQQLVRKLKRVVNSTLVAQKANQTFPIPSESLLQKVATLAPMNRKALATIQGMEGYVGTGVDNGILNTVREFISAIQANGFEKVPPKSTSVNMQSKIAKNTAISSKKQDTTSSALVNSDQTQKEKPTKKHKVVSPKKTQQVKSRSVSHQSKTKSHDCETEPRRSRRASAKQTQQIEMWAHDLDESSSKESDSSSDDNYSDSNHLGKKDQTSNSTSRTANSISKKEPERGKSRFLATNSNKRTRVIQDSEEEDEEFQIVSKAKVKPTDQENDCDFVDLGKEFNITPMFTPC